MFTLTMGRRMMEKSRAAVPAGTHGEHVPAFPQTPLALEPARQ